MGYFSPIKTQRRLKNKLSPALPSGPGRPRARVPFFFFLRFFPFFFPSTSTRPFFRLLALPSSFRSGLGRRLLIPRLLGGRDGVRGSDCLLPRLHMPGQISSPLRPNSGSMLVCPNFFRTTQHQVPATVAWNPCGFHDFALAPSHANLRCAAII